jgi:hypothetical protein
MKSQYREQVHEVWKAMMEGKPYTDSAYQCIDPNATYRCTAFPTLRTVKEAIDNYYKLKGTHDPIVKIESCKEPIITYNEEYIVLCGQIKSSHIGKGGPVEPSDPPKTAVDDYCEMYKLDSQGRIIEIVDLWDYYRTFRDFGWPMPNPDLVDTRVK